MVGLRWGVTVTGRTVKLLLLSVSLMMMASSNLSLARKHGGFRNNSFSVMDFGARGDAISDDTKAFVHMWRAACEASGDVHVLVPNRTFLLGPVHFKGPCRRARSITLLLQGYLKASKNLRRYGEDWLQFGWVDRLNVAGGGTIDGQGSFAWRYNTCNVNKTCKILPVSLKFVHSTNVTVRDITSTNSKFFHVAVVDCRNLTVSGITILAPFDSPNTDGIHVERSSWVNISGAVIGTGDDCISVGHGNSGISVSDVTCGPGHGISVGSLGRYSYEKDVRGLAVKDCVLTGTQNGLRIKTWADSAGSITAANMTFENIVMNNVSNPILIDQTYCPYRYCADETPSQVRISNISFRNIRGTSMTPVAVRLRCSRGIPCQNINLDNVHLDVAGGGRNTTADCRNAVVRYSGTQIPPPCVL